MAIFFRDLGHGQVKVSFRSAGAVDVNRFAKRFGGGGHAKVGAISFPIGAIEQARKAADEIAAELRS